MKKIAVFGSGKIGRTIISLLLDTGDYEIIMVDRFFPESVNYPLAEKIKIDINDHKALNTLFSTQKFDAVISSLPYFCNLLIAQKAKIYQSHYFDLTEDVKTTQAIARLATDATVAFVPQCGLAPGFINIAALNLMQSFDNLESVKLYCGALPAQTNNAFSYALTWSTEGLINEYCNESQTIQDGELQLEKSLEGLETITINGTNYEAFHTSGGLGSLPEDYLGKVQSMYYKTLRYPGHRDKMKFLLESCDFKHDRSQLKTLLEKNIPFTKQDIVIIYIAVTGTIEDIFFEKSYQKKYTPITIKNEDFTAIQIATASEICAAVDIILTSTENKKGYIKHSDFSFESIINNRFGKYYAR